MRRETKTLGLDILPFLSLLIGLRGRWVGAKQEGSGLVSIESRAALAGSAGAARATGAGSGRADEPIARLAAEDGELLLHLGGAAGWTLNRGAAVAHQLLEIEPALLAGKLEEGQDLTSRG
jgi:hypothetical protein